MVIVPKRLLIEGLRDVLIPETLDVVFEENNGALVLVAGPLNIQDSLKDDYYGISMAAVKMRKVVQVYQWYETEDSHNHNTVTGDHEDHVERSYSYDTDWFDHHIDSSNFANTLGTQVGCNGVPTHGYLQATTTLTWTPGQ